MQKSLNSHSNPGPATSSHLPRSPVSCHSCQTCGYPPPTTYNPQPTPFQKYVHSSLNPEPNIKKSAKHGGAQIRTEISAFTDPHRAPSFPFPKLCPKQEQVDSLFYGSGPSAARDTRGRAVCWPVALRRLGKSRRMLREISEGEK